MTSVHSWSSATRRVQGIARTQAELARDARGMDGRRQIEGVKLGTRQSDDQPGLRSPRDSSHRPADDAPATSTTAIAGSWMASRASTDGTQQGADHQVGGLVRHAAATRTDASIVSTQRRRP